MSKNKKNLVIGGLGSILVFVMGLIYIIVPSYYGLDSMASVNCNNLFLCAILVYSVTKYGEYVIVGKNPNEENVYMTIAACSAGILNVVMSIYLEEGLTLSLSILLLTTLLVLVKLFTADYYHDRNDSFWYIEIMFLIIFIGVGFITSFNLFDNSVVQSIMLGYYFAIIASLDGIKCFFKSMLKSKKFMKNLKLK